MGNQNSAQPKDSLEGRDVRQLDRRVSEMLAKGVKYNMKILVRGEVPHPPTPRLPLLPELSTPFSRSCTSTGSFSVSYRSSHSPRYSLRPQTSNDAPRTLRPLNGEPELP